MMFKERELRVIRLRLNLNREKISKVASDYNVSVDELKTVLGYSKKGGTRGCDSTKARIIGRRYNRGEDVKILAEKYGISVSSVYSCGHRYR
jgi:hypothetical protein